MSRVVAKQEPPIERSGALRDARMLGCNNPCWGDFLPGARPELSRERKKTPNAGLLQALRLFLSVRVVVLVNLIFKVRGERAAIRSSSGAQFCCLPSWGSCIACQEAIPVPSPAAYRGALFAKSILGAAILDVLGFDPQMALKSSDALKCEVDLFRKPGGTGALFFKTLY
jgi:hypothetical protein